MRGGRCERQDAVSVVVRSVAESVGSVGLEVGALSGVASAESRRARMLCRPSSTALARTWYSRGS